MHFEISVTNSDGTRRNEIIEEEEDEGNTKGKKKQNFKGPKSA